MTQEEIKTVCATYKQLDKDGRQFLRLFAQAAIEEDQYAMPSSSSPK